MGFRDFEELGGVLQHREDGPLNIDHPNGILLFGTQRVNGTILPREGQWPLLEFDGLYLIMEKKCTFYYNYKFCMIYTWRQLKR